MLELKNYFLLFYFQEQQHVPALEGCPRRWQSLHLCLQELLWQVNDQDQNIVYDHLCRFESSKMLREHVNRVHRKGRNHEIDDLEGSNMRSIGSTFHSWITFFLFFRYQCEFPGCEREYGKKQHLKEHFRKHTGDSKHTTRKFQRCTISTCTLPKRVLWMMQVTCVILATCVVKDSSCTGTWRGTCTATLESSRTLAGERKGYFPPTTLPRWKCGAIFASYGGRMKHERAQVIKSMINKNLVGWRIWQIVKAKSGSSKYKGSILVNRLK